MRILIMANNVQELGGAQRVVHVLAQGLGSRGHDVVIIGVVPNQPPHVYESSPTYDTVTLLDDVYPKDAVARLAHERLATERLQRLLDDGPPGIVITAQLWAMEHLNRCRLAGWAVIGQYHSSFEAAQAGRDLPRAKAMYRDVDAFTLLCDEDASSFRAEGFNNVVTMPNPLAYWPSCIAALLSSGASGDLPGSILRRKGTPIPSRGVASAGTGPSEVATRHGRVRPSRAGTSGPAQCREPARHVPAVDNGPDGRAHGNWNPRAAVAHRGVPTCARGGDGVRCRLRRERLLGWRTCARRRWSDRTHRPPRRCESPS